MRPKRRRRRRRCTSSWRRLPAEPHQHQRSGPASAPARPDAYRGTIMTRFTASVALVLVALVFSSRAATAQDPQPLPSPLALADVIRIAGERRDEIQAARARTTAGEARPIIVSALSDPMVSPSLDHLPFMMNGADYSVTLEQQIPLSGIRGHRRASALADVDRLRANTSRTTLDVGLEAADAYLMLQERRRTTTLVNEQIAFARDV